MKIDTKNCQVLICKACSADPMMPQENKCIFIIGSHDNLPTTCPYDNDDPQVVWTKYEEEETIMKLVRIDPVQCRCTDCIKGSSKPINLCSQRELKAIVKGELENASGDFVNCHITYVSQ